jgi:hypothetical protein
LEISRGSFGHFLSETIEPSLIFSTEHREGVAPKSRRDRANIRIVFSGTEPPRIYL